MEFEQPRGRTVCDKTTRVWCCKISLLGMVIVVLFSMVYQLWAYYTFLIEDMDEIASRMPEIAAFVNYCNESIIYQWPKEFCRLNNTILLCTLDEYLQPLREDRWLFLNNQLDIYTSIENQCDAEIFISIPHML